MVNMTENVRGKKAVARKNILLTSHWELKSWVMLKYIIIHMENKTSKQHAKTFFT